MADDNIATAHEDNNDDNGATASLLLPHTVFIKTEPCSNINNSTEDLSEFNETSTLHIPLSVPTIKNPIVLLDRCDKIWETLQLIKTVQTNKPTEISDNYSEEKKQEKVPCINKAEPSTSFIRNQRTLRTKTVSLPFKFSVQVTKKLYPCNICGKQYLERRSLRKHSERMHGIILPLLIQRKRAKKILKSIHKKEISMVTSEAGSHFKKFNNKNSHGKITAETELKNTESGAQRFNASKQFIRCTLCQQKVKSLRKHLIDYHKIGESSRVMEQLESSLLIDEKAGERKTTLKSILSGKPSQITVNDMRNRFGMMNNEKDTRKTQVKRKFALSYPNAYKRLRFNNEPHSFVKSTPIITENKKCLTVTSYECDICLGMYSSSHSLYKHRRNHIFRGETKENFHKFKCRYLNSPLNKRYKSSVSSAISTNTVVRNTSNNIIGNLSNSKLFNQKGATFPNRAVRYNGRMKKNEQTTCMCGRSFRNPHTLFVHKEKCKLYKQKGEVIQHNSDKDSTNGISITIKKRNDSYEIVGKDNDNDENTLQETTRVNEDISSNPSDSTKDSTNVSTKQQESDKSKSSNYSKDHSILKLEISDEDMIIDIENEVQINDDKRNTKQIVKPKNGKICSSKQQDNDTGNIKNDKLFDKVSTLKQMCQEVLNGFDEAKCKNAVENKSQENNQTKDKDIHQKIIQKICQENKRELRSSNKRRPPVRMESNDYTYDRIKVCTTKFDLLTTCGYCDQKFSTINSYDNHQCTVKEGKSFDEYSLQLLCFYCKEILNNYHEYDEHIKVEHFDDAYHCYHCTERFMSDRARLRHFSTEHNNLSCRFCDKKVSISVKAYHEGYHLGFGYPCHKCKKAYMQKRNLSYHNSTIHSKGADNVIPCNICLKSVKLKTFRRHMTSHKHNICHFCGKMFSNRTGLELHTMIQHGTHSKLKGMKNRVNNVVNAKAY